MDAQLRLRRYRELQAYVGWSDADASRVASLATAVEPRLPALIDDFYEAILRHEGARKVLTGGAPQVERLKGTLRRWVRELLAGRYDSEYVEGRWRVGWRHVEIGLDQVYTNVALSRLRAGLARAAEEGWTGPREALPDALLSLDTLLDLDLAIVEDAYQAEYSARLQRTERLATLGQVAGGVAHELRNPLNVIKTSAYFLLNARAASAEKSAEHLRRIERNVDLADGVIQSLSSFARMPAPGLGRVPLDACLREALELNPPGDSVAVALDCPESLPAAVGDVDGLRIVFGNLIRNAGDAMPGGGRLAISASAGDGRIEVRVVDSGVGIPPEALARVTEPLFSTKARGLGLGLAIVRSILERIGGRLDVRSRPGEGSTFTVSLVSAPIDREIGP